MTEPFREVGHVDSYRQLWRVTALDPANYENCETVSRRVRTSDLFIWRGRVVEALQDWPQNTTHAILLIEEEDA